MAHQGTLNQIDQLTQLDQLKKHTAVVADTSDFELISQYKPQDATTNPSLILKAAQKENYKELIEEAIQYAKTQNTNNLIDTAVIKLFVNFGLEILEIIPGRVSIEVDAAYSFDTKKSIQTAKKIISLFEKNHIDREQVLIKLAATWEG